MEGPLSPAHLSICLPPVSWICSQSHQYQPSSTNQADSVCFNLLRGRWVEFTPSQKRQAFAF